MTITFNAWIPTDQAISGAKWNQEAIAPSSIAVVDDPLGSGEKVVRFILDSTSVSVRSEISPVSGSRQARGSTFWYRWAYLIPSSGFAELPGGESCTIMQIHDTADGGDPSRGPPMWLEIRPGNEVWMSQNSAPPGVGDSENQKRGQAKWPLVYDVWTELVMQVYWDGTGASGTMKLWRDGRAFFISTVSPNVYDDVAPVYFKGGVYWGDSSVPDGRWTAYHKGLQVGDSAYATFDAFMAACGSSATELEGFVTRGVSL